MAKRQPAIVLLSGGLDSATVLAIALEQDFEPYALSFRYGQRHSFELECAQRIAVRYGAAKHVIFDVNLGQFGGSALTDDIAVPKDRSLTSSQTDIPVTYVPARNTVFLSVALAWAEVLGASDIFIGVNALDYSGYPDCRPEYVDAFMALANLATKTGVEGGQRLTIHAPLINLSKSEIIKRGLELNVDYSLTSTCYEPDSEQRACGRCDACQLRLRGFQENGLEDPIEYATAGVGA